MIRIKPHHFVDILTTYGGGQAVYAPHPYGHAQHTVAAQLHTDHDCLLEIELGADDICAPCAHNIEGQCDDVIDVSFRPRAPSLKREYNLLIDRRWCKRLDLKQGDRLRAAELAARIRDRAGDLADIYPEMPAQGTAQRALKLINGISKYLGGS
jgi:hypothetical protein